MTGKTSGIIALDTDPDKETNTHGEDTLKTQGWYIPEGTPTIKSANGYKYIFTYPAGVDNISNAIKFAPGLDLKADGGYVMAPSSTHPSGEPYEWITELPEDLADLPECPRWLLNIINPPEIDYEALKCCVRALASSTNDVQGVCDAVEMLCIHTYGVRPDRSILMDYAIEATEATYEAQEIGVMLSDVESEKVEWLWHNRIPLGKITILDGDPGLGKSVMTMNLAARVTKGLDLPPDPFGNVDDGLGEVAMWRSGGVVIMSAEDGLADTIKPRLEAAGADCNKVLAIATKKDDGSLTIPEDIATIEEAIKRVEAKLLIVDPLMAFLSGKANSDQDVRRALTPLSKMAERTGVAVLMVRHLNKKEAMNALYRGGGSIGIIGAARSGLIVAEHPQNKDLRVLAVSKSNLAEKPDSLTYAVKGASNGAAMVEWGDTMKMDANDLLNPDDSQITKAKAYILEELEDSPQPAKDMYAGAEKKDISKRTLERAKSDLNIRSEQLADGSWQWKL